VADDVGPEFKAQYHKKKNQRRGNEARENLGGGGDAIFAR
jgi:hypothetical protein